MKLALMTVCIAVLGAPLVMAIEEPDYELVQTTEDYEIRRYAPFIVAETDVSGGFAGSGNAAFRILGGYIFGDNRVKPASAATSDGRSIQENVKLAMTAPVLSTAPSALDADKHTYAFVMPAGYDLKTLPVPLDARVSIREVPGRLIAARRFSGRWTDKRFNTNAAALQDALDRNGLASIGKPIFARYNAPYTPWFMRRNEVMLELEFDR